MYIFHDSNISVFKNALHIYDVTKVLVLKEYFLEF